MEVTLGNTYKDGSVDLDIARLSHADKEALIKLGFIYVVKEAIKNHNEFLDPHEHDLKK